MHDKITKGNLPERTNMSEGLKAESSSCDDGNSRKGVRVRDNQPFVLNFDTRPIFIGQETFIVVRLEHNPQTDER